MIKLQDFARQQGVTDRAIQKHLSKYADELEGLFQRKGPNGTWLTDEACEILRSKMKQAPATIFEPDPRVGQLQHELDEAKAAAKELWEQTKQKDNSIALLIEQNNSLRLQAESVARLEADNEVARQKAAAAEEEKKILEQSVVEIEAQNAVLSAEKAEAEERARLEAETAQKASEELQRAEAEKAAWEKYAAELEEYHKADVKYQKRLIKWGATPPVPPVPPIEQEC